MLAVTTGRKWWLLPLLAGPCNVAGASQGSQPVDIGPSLSYTQGLVCPSGPAPGIQDLDFPSTEPGTVSCRLSTKKISLCVHLRLLYPIQHCDAERSVKICLMSSGSPMLSPLALSHHFLKLDWNSLLRNLIRPTQSRSYQLCPRLHVLTSFYKLPWFFNLKNYHDEDTNCKTESIYNIVLCENNGILLTFLCKENVLVHAFKNSKHQYSKRCLFACCWFLAAVREDKKTSAWRAFVPILWSICVLMIHCDKWKVRHLFQASGHCLDLYFDISIVLIFSALHPHQILEGNSCLDWFVHVELLTALAFCNEIGIWKNNVSNPFEIFFLSQQEISKLQVIADLYLQKPTILCFVSVDHCIF